MLLYRLIRQSITIKSVVRTRTKVKKKVKNDILTELSACMRRNVLFSTKDNVIDVKQKNLLQTTGAVISISPSHSAQERFGCGNKHSGTKVWWVQGETRSMTRSVCMSQLGSRGSGRRLGGGYWWASNLDLESLGWLRVRVWGHYSPESAQDHWEVKQNLEHSLSIVASSQPQMEMRAWQSKPPGGQREF